MRRRSVAEFLSLLSWWPEGSLLGINCGVWISELGWDRCGCEGRLELVWDLRCVRFVWRCAQRRTILNLGFTSWERGLSVAI